MVSKEILQASGSLKLCRASIEMGDLSLSEMQKPMRGDFVEARGRGQSDWYLGEG
mgnify:CR=1 FL=1